MTDIHARATTDPVDIAIGGRIRVRREARRITQAQLASSAGVTFQQIQKYERGVNRVSAARLLLIASALRTTGADLLGELEAGDLDALALARPGASEMLEAFNRIGCVDARDAALTVLRAMVAAEPTARKIGRYDVVDHDFGRAFTEAH